MLKTAWYGLELTEVLQTGRPNKDNNNNKKGTLGPVKMNYTSPLSKTVQENIFALVIVKAFSKWVDAIPMKCNRAAATAKILLQQVFTKWGSHG